MRYTPLGFYQWLFDHSGGPCGRIAACGIIVSLFAIGLASADKIHVDWRIAGLTGGAGGVICGALLTLRDRHEEKIADGEDGAWQEWKRAAFYVLAVLALAVLAVAVLLIIPLRR